MHMITPAQIALGLTTIGVAAIILASLRGEKSSVKSACIIFLLGAIPLAGFAVKSLATLL
jgi:hypothetical protein